jgi:hypothetical protein
MKRLERQANHTFPSDAKLKCMELVIHTSYGFFMYCLIKDADSEQATQSNSPMQKKTFS